MIDLVCWFIWMETSMIEDTYLDMFQKHQPVSGVIDAVR